jgi:hypothetical protein
MEDIKTDDKLEAAANEIALDEKGNPRCDLSDEELTKKCHYWVSSLARTGGRSWCLSVPVEFNNDPDMLFLEAVRRMNKYAQAVKEL